MRIHFDGRGHRILDYLSMIERYRGDAASLAVLRNFAPYRYVVCPDVEIIVKNGPLVAVDVRLIYPGEIVTVCKNVSPQGLQALRRLYKSGDLAWRRMALDGGFAFCHRGRVIENKAATDYSSPRPRR